MKLDQKLDRLPLSKSKPDALESLFGAHDLQAMWVADSEFQVADAIQSALVERVTGSGYGYEYKPDSFFEAQHHWYKKINCIELNPDHVLYTPSIPTTITMAIDQLTAEGDGIIIQPPVWPKFRGIIDKTSRKLVKNPLKIVENRYEIDFEDLASKASDSNNKMLILCNPHNPVGRVWTPSELRQIVGICKKYDLILISDEIHKDIVLFGKKFTSLIGFDHSFHNLIVCTSEAKTFNLPAILDSMAIVPDDRLRQTIKDISDRYHLGRTNALSRVALEAAYQHGEEWLMELRKTIEENISIIERSLEADDSCIKLIRPEGTFQAWLDFRGCFEDTKEMLAVVTKKGKVALNAGHWFGKEGALFMRMSIATSRERVQQAIEKIIEAV